jgi:hypothetical protein
MCGCSSGRWASLNGGSYDNGVLEKWAAVEEAHQRVA